jgi:hypothetical protein
MKTISVKLDKTVHEETENVASSLNIPFNRYVLHALDHYNTINKRHLLADTLKFESTLVAENSMSVLAEFDQAG